VRRAVTVEGMGGLTFPRGPRKPAHVRMREWIENTRGLERRAGHVYATLEEAARRMKEANQHLTAEMAMHLTMHAVRKVEGGYAWKYDNFTRAGSPYEFSMEDARDLWNQIRSPLLFIWGEDSFGKRFGEAQLDRSAFHDLRLEMVPKAGHWVQHDQFDTFLRLSRDFLAQ
jgi:pimeloyl-ACP methyl ester carboxylesterase